MSAISVATDILSPDEDLLSLAQVAELLQVPETRVHHLLREHHLLAIRRNNNLMVPQLFFSDDAIAKHLPGLIALLRDGGYSVDDILRFLFTEDNTLPGRPVDALHGHLAREVMRRAQAMAF